MTDLFNHIHICLFHNSKPLDRLNTRGVKEQVSEMPVTESMLVVRHTEQEQHWWMFRFHTGVETDLGLFMPSDTGGRTEDLHFCGRHCRYLYHSTMEPWQWDYVIKDPHNPGMVYVPATKALKCRLFRVQYSNDPTHQVVWKSMECCRLVCLRDLKPGEEITRNWSTKEDNEIVLESDSEGLLIASPFYDSE